MDGDSAPSTGRPLSGLLHIMRRHGPRVTIVRRSRFPRANYTEDVIKKTDFKKGSVFDKFKSNLREFARVHESLNTDVIVQYLHEHSGCMDTTVKSSVYVCGGHNGLFAMKGVSPGKVVQMLLVQPESELLEHRPVTPVYSYRSDAGTTKFACYTINETTRVYGAAANGPSKHIMLPREPFPNAVFRECSIRSATGVRYLIVFLVTTRSIKKGAEIVVDYNIDEVGLQGPMSVL